MQGGACEAMRSPVQRPDRWSLGMGCFTQLWKMMLGWLGAAVLTVLFVG